MMKNFVIITLLGVLLFTACKQPMKKTDDSGNAFYLGTYTNGDSEGIYKYSLNAKGHIEALGLQAKVDNPSFIAFGNGKSNLLAICETDKNGVGEVESYRIEDDSLFLMASSESGGAHPCHVCVDEDGHVVVSNYTGGNVGWLQLGENGLLSNLLFLSEHEGSGPTDRQQSPHPHSAWFVGEDMISVDLGTDQLWVYSKDAELKYKVDMELGAGPRHLCVHPNGKWIYVVNELNGTVTQLLKNAGEWEPLESYSTLPEEFEGVNTSADIHITKDGKFLYASNRGHNSIAMFQIGVDGGLSVLGYEPVKGDHPRNFSLSPSDDYLLVANQKTNNIVSFKRDKSTGLLTFVEQIKAPSPVCILFE